VVETSTAGQGKGGPRCRGSSKPLHNNRRYREIQRTTRGGGKEEGFRTNFETDNNPLRVAGGLLAARKLPFASEKKPFGGGKSEGKAMKSDSKKLISVREEGGDPRKALPTGGRKKKPSRESRGKG